MGFVDYNAKYNIYYAENTMLINKMLIIMILIIGFWKIYLLTFVIVYVFWVHYI